MLLYHALLIALADPALMKLTASQLSPVYPLQAAEFDSKVLVEQALEVREIEAAVLESLSFGEEPLVSVLGEINPQHEFYSYEAKYLDDKGAELIIPAVRQRKGKN